MFKKAPLVFIFLSVVLAAAGAWGAHRWIGWQAAKAAASKVAATGVVVAGRDLKPGHKLGAADLTLAKWPVDALPQGHFRQVGQAAGRVLAFPAVKGEPILLAKLAESGLAGGLSAVVPEGFRALTVRVDEVIGVGGFVQPGDRVDVLATISRGTFRDNPATKMVLQDVLVLTVGERLQEQSQGTKVKQVKVKVVTLQVKPDQGEKLALVATEGKILLALRNQADRGSGLTAGAHLNSLIPTPEPAKAPAPPKAVVKAAAPKKAKAPEPPKQTVEVIKGVKKTQQAI